MQRFFTFFFGFWFLVCLGQPASQQIPAKTSTAKETAKLEAELMAQFKAFAIRKRDYAKEIAARNKVKPPEGVWEFFDAVIAGDFAKAQKQYRPLARMSGQYDKPPPIFGEAFWAAVTPKVEKLFEVEILDRWRKTIALQMEKRSKAFRFVWAPTMEVFGAMEAVDMWHAKYLRMYMEDIIESIPKGSIYFGGTDPGRFAITLGSNSHEKADPFFTITQNAFADGTYLQYLRELYGKRIYIPSVEDNQIAFNDYLQDAMQRMGRGQLAPNENVTLNYPFQCLDPTCGTRQLIAIGRYEMQTFKRVQAQGGLPCPKCKKLMSTPLNPQMQVHGNGSVMAINALLAKKIFDKNPEHDFYLEESFPLGWMMPHMVPHGLIFKLERKPLKELHQDHIAQSRKDWQKYMALCVGDAVVKPETTVAELCKWVETIYIKGDALFLKGKKEVMEKPEFRKGPPFSEQKAFSKMRCGQAQLFSWRQTTTKDAELKKVYAQEADFAFRQAFALGPTNTEVASRYVNFLSIKSRFDDAKLIARTLKATDPNSKNAQILAQILLTQILRNQERQLVAKRDYVKAVEVALELVKIDKENKDQHMKRIEYYRKLK